LSFQLTLGKILCSNFVAAEVGRQIGRKFPCNGERTSQFEKRDSEKAGHNWRKAVFQHVPGTALQTNLTLCRW
jgi:hypothetical protein